jgi:tRNA dimethylallyltransferase
MIDIAEPWESYSTGRYIEQVQPVIATLHERNAIPLIVGGTGLYIKAMTRGIFDGPSADKDLREELLTKESDEPGSLYKQLQAIDPVSAAAIMPADVRRTVRALEVCRTGEKSMSEMQAENTKKLPYDYIKIGLTRERAELYNMIDKRVAAMIEQGLVDEVKQVIAAIREHHKGPIAELSSLQAIGYKELAKHSDGNLSLPDAVALIKQRSRNYAKRQFTWFRKEEGINWIDITGIYESALIGGRLIELVTSELKKN